MTRLLLRGMRVTAIAALSVVALCAPLTQAAEDDGDPIQARSYAVRFRPLADSAELVSSTGAREGSPAA